MNAWRSGCSATPLSSDQLLVVGGFDGSNHLDSTELLDLKDPWHMIGDWLYMMMCGYMIYIYFWWIKTTGCWKFDKFVYDLIQVWKLRALGPGVDIDNWWRGYYVYSWDPPSSITESYSKDDGDSECRQIGASLFVGTEKTWSHIDMRKNWCINPSVFQMLATTTHSHSVARCLMYLFMPKG